MKMKRLLVTAVFALVFITTSAQAADKGKGMYFSGNLGVSILSDADNEALGIVIETSYDPGFNIGGAFGYNYGSVRAEGEITYRSNDADTLSVLGVPFPADGEESAISFMVNGYYDFHSANSSMVPYLGGGIGVASVDANISAIGIPLVDDSATIFAYQFMAGLGFNINPTTTLTVGYRYFATSGLEFTDPTGLTFDSEYQSHDFTFGARFMF
jgi:opacity protein-like surface antigen